ncbi:hypothetical protein DYB32_001482 [Aphanomyces invadans]|nr:hypothetical protein DYB32_001482 [Aphanomyces invadans]
MAIVCVFFFCVGCGAPWGEYCMGGKYPGRVPTTIRVVSLLVQIPLFVTMALVVLARADVALPSLHSSWAIWMVVGLMGVSSVLNVITPSKWERLIWAPQVIVCFISSLAVALDM